jgi:hypothetical protein
LPAYAWGLWRGKVWQKNGEAKGLPKRYNSVFYLEIQGFLKIRV